MTPDNTAAVKFVSAMYKRKVCPAPYQSSTCMALKPRAWPAENSSHTVCEIMETIESLKHPTYENNAIEAAPAQDKTSISAEL